MQLTFNPAELAAEITPVCRVAKTKATLPILTTLRLRVVGENDVRCEATDLEHSLSVRVTASCDAPAGTERILNASLLLKSVKGLDGDTATLSDDGDGWMVLVCERTTILLPSEDPTSFPQVPTCPRDGVATMQIGSSALADVLDATHFAISTDATRVSFMGLHIVRDGDYAVFTATDGHQLAQSRMGAAWEGDWPNAGIIVPGFAVSKLRALNKRPASKESTTLFNVTDELFVQFVGEPLEFSSRLIPGRFPNVAQVVPKGEPPRATVNTADLQATLRRAKAHVPATGHVRLSLAGGGLRVTAQSDTQGAFDEALDCSYDAPPTAVGFNVKYLLDILGASLGDKVDICAQSVDAPTLIKDSGRKEVTWIVMPMQF